MTPRLTDDQIWAAIDAQRLRVCDLLDLLTDEEWRHSSLCDGWTVRDVAGHLTLQQATWGQALPNFVKYRANTHRMIREWARDRAARLSTDQLVAEIRATVGTHRTNAGTTNRESLIDSLVHGRTSPCRSAGRSRCRRTPPPRPPLACGRCAFRRRSRRRAR